MAIVKFRPIQVDDFQQELTQHGTSAFPLSMDEQHVDDEGCHQIPHWHYEIQIAVVTHGSVTFRTPAGDITLREGEGIFINSTVIHEVLKGSVPGSIYICVNFKPEMVYGQSDSIIRQDYVDPITFNTDLQVVPLTSEPWQQEICQLVTELRSVNDAQEYGYELEMKILLCRIWHHFLVNNKQAVERTTSIAFSDRQRFKVLQQYICKNYMERISLQDIAQAAHISRGECCRVFQRVQHESPIQYLLHYRIRQSVKLLTCTGLSISDIAQQAGFSSSSYYTECFKKEMKCKPLDYRKQHKVSRKQDA